jgi:DNA repair exonuclease SbcCD ATPase subunit
MIKLKQITIQNVLSYGNTPTTLRLDQYRNTLIASSSGSGKSVWVDAVCYALYSKPYRNIKLPQLINSINLKGMLTTIEFSIGSIEYKVIRGMKPNIFEIYQNGILLAQEAATRDYQGYLVNSILKINHKTFCQVVLIGTAGFTPFMQLPAGQRRDVVEDVLDIAVFSEMNVILRQRIQDSKDNLLSVNNRLEGAKKDTQNQLKIIKLMEGYHDDKINNLKSQITELELSIASLMLELSANKTKQSQLKQNLKPLPTDTSRNIFLLQDELIRAQKKLSSIDDMESCPTCMQCVTVDHKKITDLIIQDRIIVIGKKLENLQLNQLEFDAVIEHNNKIETENKNLSAIELSKLTSIESKQKDILTFEKNISSLELNTSGLEAEKIKLKTVAADAIVMLEQKKQLLTERSVQDISLGLLKDSGIKSKIINEYIPILNKLINKYLGEFGFFVNFTLDEHFNEKILSRGRDEFGYNSFSEGEKARIDLSILFAFRQITEMKNSASVNLLFLDEISDSALDLNSKEAFIGILSQLENGNNFVISHNAPDTSIYDQVISISKKNDFSTIEYSE